MFARYFIELPWDRETVERTLVHDPTSWFRPLAEHANLRGDRLLAEVGFGDDIRVARRVEIEVAAPIRVATKTVLPVRWTATGMSGLFPALDADLEIAPLGERRCQLSMSARYVPPLGVLGRTIDRALLFRIAEATIKDFLDRVGDAIARSVADEGARAGTRG